MQRLPCLIAIVLVAPFLSAAAAEIPVQHRVLAADGSTHTIALLDDSGHIQWRRTVGDIHDLQYLPGGTILLQESWTHLLEVRPGIGGADDAIVWQYDAATMNGNAGKAVQVHAFQRLPDGSTMIAESGIGRIIEVDHEGRLLRQMRLKRDHPNLHSDTRLARKIDNGHYLVAQEADGAVREYDANGQVVWEYDVPLFGRQPAPGHGPEAFGNQVFAAVRLRTGNTLIATGNGHSVLEVTPAKQIVWRIDQNDLPGIQLAWVTTLQPLADGHIVFGNCHAGEKNPQIIEVDRDKHVCWSFKDFHTFGNALSNSFVLPPNEGRPAGD